MMRSATSGLTAFLATLRDGLLIYYWDHETIPTVLDEMEAGIQDDEETGIEVKDLDA